MSTIGNLPEEVMIEILLRLPMVSILSLKYMSKQWYNLIRDPNFFNLYNTQTTSSTAFYINNKTLQFVLFNNNTTIYSLHRLPIPPRYHDLISGLSNATVLCLKTADGHFLLHNLLTGASHTVTYSPPQQPQGCHLYYGFGYDRHDHDYRILVVSTNILFWVYSFNYRRWKSFSGPNRGFPSTTNTWPHTYGGGTCSFNGVLHFVVSEKLGILTFDLHSCRFGEIEAPRDCHQFGLWSCDSCKVSELDGRLCFLMKRVGGVLDMWVMKEYRVVESWTKLFGFGCRSLAISRLLIPLFKIAHTLLYERRDGTKLVLLVCHGSDLYGWCYVHPKFQVFHPKSNGSSCRMS